MATQKHSPKRFRLVIKPSSPLLKVILLVAIVLCTATLLVLRTMIRATAAWYEQENAELVQNIAQLGTEKSIRRIATEELGLVDPDATFFQGADSTNPE